MLGGRLQLGLVIAEQLDLDRLGHGGEVADHVFHQLGGLDLDARHPGFDPITDIGHHRLYVAPMAGLQADEHVTGVGFGQPAAQLGAGAPRIGQDLRRVANDPFDLSQ